MRALDGFHLLQPHLENAVPLKAVAAEGESRSAPGRHDLPPRKSVVELRLLKVVK
jgi:hypothetical protein